MRAAYIESHGDTEVLKVGELPDPTVNPNSVLVQLKFSALNHLDIWVRKGLPGLKLSYPHILGGDGSGTITRVGAQVKGLAVGDEVIVHPGLACGKCTPCSAFNESLCEEYKILGEHVSGTNAEYVAVPAENIFKKPGNLSSQEAAGIALVFTTAWQMLKRRAQVKTGNSVLIHGAGSGVSLAGIQIAKEAGAFVIATSTSRKKLEVAKSLGADHLICTADEEFGKNVRKLYPKGVDIVFDHVGKAFWEQNIKITRSGGTLVTCGATTGHDAATDLRHIFYRQIQVLGSTMGSKKDFPEILSLFEAKKFRSHVDKLFSLQNIKEAHLALERQSQCGKVLLEI